VSHGLSDDVIRQRFVSMQQLAASDHTTNLEKGSRRKTKPSGGHYLLKRYTVYIVFGA
jgi:hypothetical protein